MEEIVFTDGEKAMVIGYCVAAVAILALAIYWKYRLDKYEFENRTDGGVVQFRDFGAAQFHRFQRFLIGIVGSVGVLAVLGGILAVLAVFTTFFD